jgi:hypothetical protein
MAKLYDKIEHHEIERSLAFERASGAIESECLPANVTGEEYYDLDSATTDLSQEIDYLDTRNLLIFHPDNHRWVAICDEDEPLGVVELETRIPIEGTVA